MDIIRNVFEGLVAWDAANRLAPALAEKWDVSPDGKVYTFHLRKGVKFHNGRLLTADDVQFSLERACDPQRNSPTSLNYLGDIVGVKQKLAGKAESISGIKVLDPSTVQITVDRARPYFLGKLTYPCAFVVCKEAVQGANEISSMKEMVGTGPFMAEGLVPEQQLSLQAFAGYWGGKPKIDRLVELVMKDAQTRVGKFRAGDVQIAGVLRQDVPPLRKELGDQVRLLPRPAVAYVAMSRYGYAPFQDRRVRRAIAMAADVKSLVSLLGGTMEPAEAILPPGIEGHREHPNGLPFDPPAAARELADAGYPGGKGLPPLELIVRDQTPDTRVIAEAMSSQLHKNLGIEVPIRTMEWRTMLEARNHNKLGFFILSWYADYLDPQNFLSTLLTTKGDENHFGYSNLDVDRLCDQADGSTSPGDRTKLYQQAEDLILQDAPWIPLYYVRDPQLVSPRVHDLQDNLMGTMPYTKVWVK